MHEKCKEFTISLLETTVATVHLNYIQMISVDTTSDLYSSNSPQINLKDKQSLVTQKNITNEDSELPR